MSVLNAHGQLRIWIGSMMFIPNSLGTPEKKNMSVVPNWESNVQQYLSSTGLHYLPTYLESRVAYLFQFNMECMFEPVRT